MLRDALPATIALRVETRADDVFALMREFNRERGITFLVVTHDPRLAQRCDRVVELLDGHVVRDERIRPGAPS